MTATTVHPVVTPAVAATTSAVIMRIPDDILLGVLAHLGPSELGRLAQCSHQLQRVAYHPAVWPLVFRRLHPLATEAQPCCPGWHRQACADRAALPPQLVGELDSLGRTLGETPRVI